jgi:hypothetical protein
MNFHKNNLHNSTVNPGMQSYLRVIGIGKKFRYWGLKSIRIRWNVEIIANPQELQRIYNCNWRKCAFSDSPRGNVKVQAGMNAQSCAGKLFIGRRMYIYKWMHKEGKHWIIPSISWLPPVSILNLLDILERKWDNLHCRYKFYNFVLRVNFVNHSK